ncbi:MAG TPA: prolyl oligopeptidase family serine peptidase [Candidatus Paceibacterota bacterium]|nr:prolyl oligopeptidase family serine peptidase [Candidatus Paceibacterota bacterium]
MKFHRCAALILPLLAAGCGGTRSQNSSLPTTVNVSTNDPHLWLEDVTGEKQLDWVRKQNAATTNELESAPDFQTTHQRLLSMLNSKERIPGVVKRGAFYYNFWQDGKNPRGLWRRTTLEEYRKPQPNWETVLDIDRLAKDENANWIWKGAEFLEPEFDRVMLVLSRGGADASVQREFDVVRKEFVRDNGFLVPEAKSEVAWRNRDTLYVGTDFGPGSLTKSGYPRLIKEWIRGTPLSEAKLIFEAKEDEIGVSATVIHDHGRIYELFVRLTTFFSDETFLRQGEELVRIDKPTDAEVSTFDHFLLLRLRSDWVLSGRTNLAGSLLAVDFNAYLKGDRTFAMLFKPEPRTSLAGFSATKHFILLNVLDNVRSRPLLLREQNGQWTQTALEAPEFGTVNVSGVDANESDDYFMTVADYLTPSTLYLGVAGQPDREKLKSLPALFDATGLEIQQFNATSRDETLVPYFQVSRKDMALNGKNPTLLYGYGGFEISLRPDYNAGVGASWLERGGVYAVANIRGGGEFGPQWHNAARKEHRQRAYDDFISVAEDMIHRKVTSPAHLGIQGGSNGGLLMGVMLTERPDLFGAVVCQVPLLDMRRYNRLLAGASWVDEYGDPDKPEEWAYLSRFSPYQNIHADQKYPRVLFTTSTRDDRVHPGHARKMVARMEEQGHDVLYYENIEGGHGGAANNEQRAFMAALAYTFLWKELNR